MHLTDEPFERTQGAFAITTDRSRLDLDRIESFLRQLYWAAERSRGLIERSVEQSLPFGLYDASRQVGFCRFITDRASFVFISRYGILPVFFTKQGWPCSLGRAASRERMNASKEGGPAVTGGPPREHS